MHYKNFKNATYAPAPYLQEYSIEQIAADFQKVSKYLKLDKIYLETYRVGIVVDREKLVALKKMFEDAGLQTAAGITANGARLGTGPVEAGFQTNFGVAAPKISGTLMGALCYTSKESLEALREIVAYSAKLFDEIILDDFYFTNCRCESCIAAKGERSWDDFRRELMTEVSKSVVLSAAREANPNVKVIIKYPNWYESFADCGYDPETESKMFDGIYTGTETRDPHYTHQNLQRYLSYFLPRLMENVRPGDNGGGWFDIYDCNLEDYVQQASLTLFSKCRENMLFCLPLMANYPSFFMAAAGALYDDTDELIGKLGNPVGIACYKPYHSNGERHLYDYFGMLGLPLEPFPYYPADAKTVLLTESAANDELIVEKMKQTLCSGGKVFVTSGLYQKLSSKGIRGILPMEITEKKVTSRDFSYSGYGQNLASFAAASEDVTLSRITYSTNNFWVLSAALTPHMSHPFLLSGEYGGGQFYVINIPDAAADLYKMPEQVLTLLRGEFDLSVTLESKAQIGLFLYDNETFILQSFLSRPERVRLRISQTGASLEPLSGTKADVSRSLDNESVFEVLLHPGRSAAFRIATNQ